MTEPGKPSVSIKRADGAITPCTVTRADPPADDTGHDLWVAAPGDGQPFSAGDTMLADEIPANAVIKVPLAAPDPGPAGGR